MRAEKQKSLNKNENLDFFTKMKKEIESHKINNLNQERETPLVVKIDKNLLNLYKESIYIV